MTIGIKTNTHMYIDVIVNHSLPVMLNYNYNMLAHAIMPNPCITENFVEKKSRKVGQILIIRN